MPAHLRHAAALGAVSGVRTFTAPAALALRGRLGGRATRAGLLALAGGELAGDKHPRIPPRTDPGALSGRIAAGALSGRTVAGTAGAGVGAASAAAATYVSERARSLVQARTGLPDPLLGVAEDAVAVGVAAIASRDGSEPPDEPPAHTPSPLAAAVRGLTAAALGTAAMTAVQTAYGRATGSSGSGAPGKVGRRFVHGVLHRRVPRNRRAALNQGMHALYGTAWGLPFGLAAGTRPGAPVARGLAFGLTVWAAGLAALPALGIAPPPWKQSVAALAPDLAFHLVYGGATSAAYEALAA